MTIPKTILLNNSHDKQKFRCGKDMLDTYLHKQAKQDVKKKIATCFVLAEENIIKGYYTLSSTSIPRKQLSEAIIKKLPPTYTDIPATLLGRLAIDHNFKGQKLGEHMLIDALKRCYDVSVNGVASMAVIVDPIDNDAVKFYEKYGFILIPGTERMFLLTETILKLFGSNDL